MKSESSVKTGGGSFEGGEVEAIEMGQYESDDNDRWLYEYF